eukprot:jgi/Galph1/868/GphlegSOOS_G5618.1
MALERRCYRFPWKQLFFALSLFIIVTADKIKPFLISWELPTFWLEDASLEQEDFCVQVLQEGATVFEKLSDEKRLVVALNQNLADISSAKVLPVLGRLGVKGLFLVDYQSIVSNENVLINLVSQGHFVALKNTEVTSGVHHNNLLKDIEVYYEVLEQAPVFLAIERVEQLPRSLPLKLMPIFLNSSEREAFYVEREGDLESILSMIIEDTTLVRLEELMSTDQLLCIYHRLGCLSEKIQQGTFRAWCDAFEGEFFRRYTDLAHYISCENNLDQNLVKERFLKAPSMIERNAKRIEDLYETWSTADNSEDSLSVIHLWPKRQVMPVPFLDPLCLERGLSRQENNFWNMVELTGAFRWLTVVLVVTFLALCVYLKGQWRKFRNKQK